MATKGECIMAGLTKRPNGIWYIVYRVDGRQKMTSTGTRRKSEADTEKSRWEKKRAKERAAGIDPDSKPDDPEPDDFWPCYEVYSEMHLRKSTRDSRGWVWRRFLAEYHPDTLGAVTVDRIQTDRATWKGKAVTWNDWHRGMRAIYNVAIKVTLPGQDKPMFRGVNPFVQVKPLPEHPQDKRVLTEDEIAKLLEEAVKHSKDARADNIAAVFALGLYAGLRRGEICACKWEWIDFATKRINVTNEAGGFVTKNSKNRSIPLFNVLLPYLGEPKESGYIYRPDIPWKPGESNRLAIKTSFNHVCELAGMKWVTCHLLRHTFITHCLQRGCPVWEVGKWAGHSSQFMTEHYGHYIQPDAATLDLFGK
jgi:integrase